MDFRWQYAERFLAKLDSPDYGTKESWMRWYKDAWAHLSEQGLTTVDTPLDFCVVRLRILALCWLSHDFCGVVQADEEFSTPYWQEWIEFLELDPVWCLVTALDEQLTRDIVIESELESPDNIEAEDDELVCDHNEINRDLLPRLVMGAVYFQRSKVVDALIHALGGESMLFASIYGNTLVDSAIDERRSSLEDELEWLEEEEQQVMSEVEKSKLQRKIEFTREQLSESALAEAVVEGCRESAVGDPIYFCDQESEVRMKGLQWFEEGCRVVIRGVPEFWIP